MDFDKPKVYGDTSITDGFVSMTVVQGTINCASLLTGSRSKEEMGGIARDKDIILKILLLFAGVILMQACSWPMREGSFLQ